jgi:ankyrin repeat protein
MHTITVRSRPEVTVQSDLELLRGRARELARSRGVRLSEAQLELAREQGFTSWQKLKGHVGRLGAEQPFRSDIEYYEARAEGLASTSSLSIADARGQLACRHGFSSWRGLRSYVASLPETPFVFAYRAVEDNDLDRLTELLDRYPDLVHVRGTNGNDLLGIANGIDLVRLLLERGADPNRANGYGWTKLHQAGYSNRRELAQLMLRAGARTDVSARGEGGTPLIVALFWGHRDVVDLLGREPRNLRVAAGLGDLELIGALAWTAQAGAHRGFYRPHAGFPVWRPSDDPQEVLDEALVWAAKSDRIEALPLLVDLGARINADPYRGTPLIWAAANGRVASIRTLVDLGADVNHTASFGGPDHGEGVTALHLAAQAGRRAAVETLLELGADPSIRDALHDSPPSGWAAHGGHPELIELFPTR